jgi:prepilin-type N-terminal cleavage/methylation domain-containing protein
VVQVSRSARPGFTLLEVVIALALGGVVLLGAHSLLDALADEARRLPQDAAVGDRDENGERLLRALVGRLEVGTSEVAQFSGDPTAARFTTWCDVPSGWLERCDVVLAIESAEGLGPDEHALVAYHPDGGRTVLIRRDVQADGLRYLNTAANGGEWFRTWGRGITAPIAIGILLPHGTLIVRIGERG